MSVSIAVPSLDIELVYVSFSLLLSYLLILLFSSRGIQRLIMSWCAVKKLLTQSLVCACPSQLQILASSFFWWKVRRADWWYSICSVIFLLMLKRVTCCCDWGEISQTNPLFPAIILSWLDQRCGIRAHNLWGIDFDFCFFFTLF